MLVLLSPSKKLDKIGHKTSLQPTQPALLNDGAELVDVLKDFTEKDIKNLMGLSDNLANLNFERYQNFPLPLTPSNAHPAIFTFKGDVYDNMDVEHYNDDDLSFAQKHLRILSGLYGVLRPLDLIHPYRLEMGTKLKNKNGANLYSFWGDKITKKLNADKEEVIVNLASQEYFKAVKKQNLNARLLTVDFKQIKGGKTKTIGLMAKRARGMMADFIIKNKLTNIDALKDFTMGGYKLNSELSTTDTMVFTLNMDIA